MCDTNLRDLVDFRCNEMHQFHITFNPWDVRKWNEMSSLKVLKLPWSKSEPYSKCKPSNLSQLGRDTASSLNGWNCSLPLSLSLSLTDTPPLSVPRSSSTISFDQRNYTLQSPLLPLSGCKKRRKETETESQGEESCQLKAFLLSGRVKRKRNCMRVSSHF